jgi:hypothetical protein
MLITTCAALVWKGYIFVSGPEPNYTLAIAAALLFVMAIYVGVKGFAAIRRGA